MSPQYESASCRSREPRKLHWQRDRELRDDLKRLLDIAERERLEMLDQQGNTTREAGRQLGLAMRRVREAFLDD